ncbi:MAG: hypothetical protein RLZZ469_1640 [Bacteroidota bacterium]|jgi:hypothetical protein
MNSYNPTSSEFEADYRKALDDFHTAFESAAKNELERLMKIGLTKDAAYMFIGLKRNSIHFAIECEKVDKEMATWGK